MAVGAGLDTLEALYNELVSTMNQIDGVITSVDQKFGAARAEWKGQGEADFETQWAQDTKNLSLMCQHFAAAARSLADQHNSFAYAAREQGASELNVNVQSPR